MEQAVGSDESIFTVRPSLTRRIWLLRLGAILLFAVAAVGFFLALITRADMIRLQATTTLPSLFAVGLLMSARAASQTPRSVKIGPSGVTVASAKQEHLIPWQEIAIERVDTAAVSQHRRLTLFGNDGRKLATISQEIQNFDLLHDLIKSRLSQEPSPQADSVRLRKMRKTGLFLIGGGVGAILLAAANGYMVYSDQMAEHLLTTRGVETSAIISRKFIAPDGMTHRIEYSVKDLSGKSASNNVEVEKLLWTVFEEGQAIAVVAVPGRPYVSRLIVGQIKDSMQPAPTLGWLLCAGVGILGIGFIAGGIVNRRGIDITWNSATGRFKITRLSDGANG